MMMVQMIPMMRLRASAKLAHNGQDEKWFQSAAFINAGLELLPLASVDQFSFQTEVNMSRGMPSMVALLGLLALAGYQNRDKLAEAIRGMGQNKDRPPGEGGRQEGLGGVLGGLGGILGGATSGSVLSGGIGDLVDRFRQTGQGEAAESWVRKGPNQAISPDQLERALGADVVATLAEKTGLSREELLSRLSRTLPEAVDNLTPEGRVPTEAEASRIM
jgi:uncharacterized protein YidB (DUF937 family)